MCCAAPYMEKPPWSSLKCDFEFNSEFVRRIDKVIEFNNKSSYHVKKEKYRSMLTYYTPPLDP